MLKPFLEGKVTNSWLDPRKVKNKDDFFYEYTVSWGFAQAASEILDWINQKITEAKYLQKKEKGEITQIRIGGDTHGSET